MLSLFLQEQAKWFVNVHRDSVVLSVFAHVSEKLIHSDRILLPLKFEEKQNEDFHVVDDDYEFIELFRQANVDEDLVESVIEWAIDEFDVDNEKIVKELIYDFNPLLVKANELGLFHLVVSGLSSQV